MKIDSTEGQKRTQEKAVFQPQNRKADFSRLFTEHASGHDISVAPNPGEDQKRTGPAAPNANLVHLGTITGRVPTVSDLLVKHPVYRKDTWNIIHSESNKDRPYTEIRPGTDIYLDPGTHEILWNRDGFHFVGEKTKETACALASHRQEKTEGGPEKDPGWIDLGVISQASPTVSHLLREQPAYKPAAYRIIHSEINQAKPYDKMLEGTRVYLNPASLEISWDQENGKPAAPLLSHKETQPPPEVRHALSDTHDPFSENLVQSVSHFVGSPYEEMNCFELLVRGLNKMGIGYAGRGGLYDRLVKMAAARGLPENAFLNGEGLVEASGTQVYFKSIPRVHDPEALAKEIFKEMEPALNRGFVLSFSTQSRGHTGVVSQKDRLWTYINSGTLDHRLGRGHDSKGVGEEVLAEEIKNWLRLAAESEEPLKITLGRLNPQKLLGMET